MVKAQTNSLYWEVLVQDALALDKKEKKASKLSSMSKKRKGFYGRHPPERAGSIEKNTISEVLSQAMVKNTGQTCLPR